MDFILFLYFLEFLYCFCIFLKNFILFLCFSVFLNKLAVPTLKFPIFYTVY